MENLYIYLDENGRPEGHPITESNLKQLKKNIDINSLPENITSFERVPLPKILKDEKIDSSYSVFEDGIVRDVHVVLKLTQDELYDIYLLKKKEWEDGPILINPSWIYDENLQEYEPPLPYPDDGNAYSWDESSVSWVIREDPTIDNE